MGRKTAKKTDKTKDECKQKIDLSLAGEEGGGAKQGQQKKQKKRKKSHGSPSGSSIQPAEKRSATMNGDQCSQMNSQGINGQSSNQGVQQQDMFTNNMSQSYSQLLTQPPPHLLNMTPPSVSVYQPPAVSYNSQLLDRLDSIDNKLKSLGSIEKQLVSMNTKISGLDLRLQENEKSVKTLNAKVSDLEDSRNFDAGFIDQVKKTETSMRKELDQTKHVRADINKATEERYNIKEDYAKLKAENDKLKSDLTDLKGRSMRNNLLFYNLAERQENRRNENCEEKVLQFCEVELEMSNARNQLAIERAHRIGEYKPAKTRPGDRSTIQ